VTAILTPWPLSDRRQECGPDERRGNRRSQHPPERRLPSLDGRLYQDVGRDPSDAGDDRQPDKQWHSGDECGIARELRQGDGSQHAHCEQDQEDKEALRDAGDESREQ
jgi:hypothetical protein